MGGSMIKRFFLALAFAGLLSPAYGAGTIPFSLSQQFDSLGKPLGGCKLYTIQAGTVSTPQNAYQDSALTLALPNPQTCDAAGRLPQMFIADGQVKVRLTDKNGVNILTADNIQVVGASSGGGGGGTVDPTTIIATGDIKSRYGTGVLSGFVRLNGRTVGSATSGATERANADTQALFEYLWGADSTLAVSTGRGASANADWVANKTITLPDGRGRVLAALDDMGNTAAGRLTSTYFGIGFSSNGTTLGAVGGNESQTLVFSQLPIFTPTFTGTSGALNLTPSSGGLFTTTAANVFVQNGAGASLGFSTGQSVAATGSFTPVGTISQIGGGGAHTIVQPTILVTNYIKL